MDHLSRIMFTVFCKSTGIILPVIIIHDIIFLRLILLNNFVKAMVYNRGEKNTITRYCTIT